MERLAQRSIIRKLMTVLEFAGNSKTSPAALASKIFDGRRVEFSYFRPADDPRRRLGYCTASSIREKVKFAIALKVLNADCALAVDRKDFNTEEQATLLLSERTRDLLDSARTPISTILRKSQGLLRREPPELPTAHKLFAVCKAEGLSFRRFRFCLSILLYEPNGSLGASARRIYIPRPAEHQMPGEIGG